MKCASMYGYKNSVSKISKRGIGTCRVDCVLSIWKRAKVQGPKKSRIAIKGRGDDHVDSEVWTRHAI